MTYEELVQKAREIYADADASKVKEHVAIQFNIQGEAEGAFYLEIVDGKVVIEPYEYYDRDVIVTTTADMLQKVTEGKADMVKAYLSGELKAEGNLDKALLLQKVVTKKPAKKAAAKKTTAKKPAAKKETAKPAAKKPAAKKEAAKPAEKKTATKTTTAKKTAAKKTEK